MTRMAIGICRECNCGIEDTEDVFEHEDVLYCEECFTEKFDDK